MRRMSASVITSDWTSISNGLKLICLMQTNRIPSGGAQPSDLLSAIYRVEVRNEEKISATDRAFCEQQQTALYETLEQIERCHALLRTEAGRYCDLYNISDMPNGRLVALERCKNDDAIPTDYRIAACRIFDTIETFVKLYHDVNEIFAARIVRYFNETYNVSVPIPNVDAETLMLGTRPVYTTYVDRVIEHLGGRSFRDTAEEEILERFLNLVRPGRWAKSKPEVKGCKITFPNIVSYDDFYIKWDRCYHMAYGNHSKFDTFCEGIIFGADNRLNGSRESVIGLNTDDVDLTRWYDTATESGIQLQFFKNGRIDVKFKDAATAEASFRRLRLQELLLHNDNS